MIGSYTYIQKKIKTQAAGASSRIVWPPKSSAKDKGNNAEQCMHAEPSMPKHSYSYFKTGCGSRSSLPFY
jgi:hypothetical protein